MREIPEDIRATVEDLFEDSLMRPFRNDEAKRLVARAILAERGRIQTLLMDPAAVRVNYLRGDIACQPLIDEAVEAERQRYQWQPIETAPHGTRAEPCSRPMEVSAMRELPRDLVTILRTEARNQRTPPIDYIIAGDGGRMVHRPDPDIAMAELLEEAASALAAKDAELARRDMQLEASAKVALDLSAQLAEARKALDGLLEPFEGDDCRYDHHGHCQAHFLQEGDECCVKIARRVREGGKADG